MFRARFRFQLWIMTGRRFGFFVEIEVKRESGGDKDVDDDEIKNDVDKRRPLDQNHEVEKVGGHFVT